MNNDFRLELYRKKYAITQNETFDDMVDRLVSILEAHENRKHYEKVFKELTGKDLLTFARNVFSKFHFLPAGRVLYGAGRKGKFTLFNCFVLDSPEDTIEGIFETAKKAAITYSYGGGCGIDLSSLRPEGSPVSGPAKTSTGAWSWAELYSVVTGLVGQEGRRGALLLSMNVHHPDIMRFITMKNRVPNDLKFLLSRQSKIGKIFVEKVFKQLPVRNANISVGATDIFMKAVESDSTIVLSFGEIQKEVVAKEIYDLIVENAWASAEPGLLFLDTINKWSNSSGYAPIVTTNPCGEEPLPANTACNLGSINVKVIDDLDYLKEVAYFATIFLDSLIDVSQYPLPEQEESVKRDRRIGVGIMGLADRFLLKGIVYGSPESLREASKVMQVIRNATYEMSMKLAEEVGPAPIIEQLGMEKFYEQANFYRKFYSEPKPLRNVTLLSCAPTGSISLIAGVSSGIEPIFYPEVTRNVLGEDVKIIHPAWEEAQKLGVNKNAFVTFRDIHWRDRIKMQAVIQKHVDAAVSSTVNLPESATKEDVADLFILAWKSGLKGITIYREGSRESIFKTFSFSGERPDVLQGKVFKLPYMGTNYYIIVSGNKYPREVFSASKHTQNWEFNVAFNVTLSRVLRLLHDIGDKELMETELEDIIDELYNIEASGWQFYKGKRFKSAVNLWAYVLEQFLQEKGIIAHSEYSVCPQCGFKIKGRYDFDCSNPCPNCGYAGKCSS